MNRGVTEAMVEAALAVWFETNEPWYGGMANDVIEGCHQQMRACITAALAAEPGAAEEEKRGNFVAFTTDEPQIGNWHTAIYEDDYKGLLIAMCNQNGRYPWQVKAILAGLNAVNDAKDTIAAARALQQGGKAE